ncbi:agmatinase [Desulfothermus sp.]
MYSKYADDEGQGKEIIVLPVPYEGAVSFGTGTKKGPMAILRASLEIETWDEELEIDLLDVAKFNTLDYFEPTVAGPKYVFESLYNYLKSNLDPAKDFLLTIGGDHSVALAPIKFYHDYYKDLFVLQIDAHCDLREEFQGSKYSHGSVMARVRDLDIPIIQLGIRSLCKQESERLKKDSNITTCFARDIFNLSPQKVAKKIKEILNNRPLYLTFDVDGVDPSIVPGTGTPEPGGIPFFWLYDFWIHLFKQNISLVGMDVCELAPIPNQLVSESTVVKFINRILCAYLVFYNLKQPPYNNE